MREATLDSEKQFLQLANNISTAQLHILLTIGDYEPCSMSKVATIMGFSKANMTQMVDRLIRKKFVKKIKNQNDQRITLIILLSKGKKIIDLNRAHIENMASNWFSNMTDEEQEGMLSVWERYLFNHQK